MVLRALRWQYLLEPIGHARFGPAFRTTTIGFAASAVLPARAGEVIRPYLLARQEGLSATATFATIIIERLLDAVTCVMLLASFVLFFDPGMDSADSRLYWLVEVGGVTVGALALVVLGAMFVAARDPGGRRPMGLQARASAAGKLTHRLAGALLKFAEGLAVVRTPRRLRWRCRCRFRCGCRSGSGIWAVTRAFGIDMPFTGSFLLIALLVVGVSVPTPGGVGGFEAAVQIGLTSFYGVPNDRAVGAALVLHAVSLLPTLVLGFLFVVQDGLGFGGMRNLAHARLTRTQAGARSDRRRPDEVSVLRASRRQGRRLAREPRRRSHPPPARMPRLRQALHQLRADRRDPVHGGEEGRQPRAVRAAEADRRLLKACEKRPVSVAALEAVADRVESTLQERAEKEISTAEIGAFVMEELKKLDKVAYVRFASVYRHFRDIGEFMTELKDLLNAKE